MSSTNPILTYQSIDQLNVTEVNDEVKSRKLVTKGLKEGLINCLDEALTVESVDAEVFEKDEVDGFNGSAAKLKDAVADTGVKKSSESVESDEEGNSAVVHPTDTENEEKIPDVVNDESGKSDKQYGITKLVVVDNDSSAMVEQVVEQMDLSAGADSANVAGDLIHASTRETSATVTESVLTEVVVSGQEDSCSAKPPNGHGQDSVIKQEDKESNVRLSNEESKPELDCDLKPPCEHIMPNSLLLENQVSEVNPSLGSQVRFDSVSSNFVSINQKNEIKDTIITNNVKLEQEIVRSEMVEEPSSKIDVPVSDESHSMDVEELDEKKASAEENDSNNRSPDMNKANISEDVGYPEKLNLDGSSGDDSMEEDFPEEGKQFDSNFNVDELKEKGESVEVPVGNEEHDAIAVGDGLSSGKGGTQHNNNIPSVSLVKKQKFQDQTSVENNEPPKRQKRWKSETVKGSDSQMSTVRPATAPKGEPVALKRNLSWSDSSAIDDAPKERIVPPSQRPPTNSLRIDRFIRPFTLKAVQELLGKSGNITSFWMDQIKTHCYVSYSTVEEATETRDAVYNLQWPPKGGRLLVAEYVEPQEVRMKLEPPPHVAFANNDSTVPPVTTTSLPEPFPYQHKEQPPVPVTLLPPPPLSKLLPAAREQLPPPPPLSKLPPAAREQPPPPPPSGKLPPAARERLPLPPPLSKLPPAPREWLPPPSSLPEKVDRPILTIDDIFRKTIATPQIYYSPLSEEQVAAKLAALCRSIKQ